MCFQEFVVQITSIEKYLLIKEKGKKKKRKKKHVLFEEGIMESTWH